jgi:hypothetical protein
MTSSPSGSNSGASEGGGRGWNPSESALIAAMRNVKMGNLESASPALPQQKGLQTLLESAQCKRFPINALCAILDSGGAAEKRSPQAGEAVESCLAEGMDTREGKRLVWGRDWREVIGRCKPARDGGPQGRRAGGSANRTRRRGGRYRTPIRPGTKGVVGTVSKSKPPSMTRCS